MPTRDLEAVAGGSARSGKGTEDEEEEPRSGKRGSAEEEEEEEDWSDLLLAASPKKLSLPLPEPGLSLQA